MVPVEDFILGSGTLHERFCLTTEILAKLVSSAPRSVSIAQLENETGRSPEELTALCESMTRLGLLCRDPLAQERWLLTCDASMVTLEDVYRCVLAERPQTAGGSGKAVAVRAQTDVDLLVMQAMIEINQSVLKHLRQFSLDRLKASAAGMFPASRHRLRNASGFDAFELPSSGRQAVPVSSDRVPA